MAGDQEVKLAGMSLSFCVKDICEGKIPIERVELLVTSTRCLDSVDFATVIASYQRVYWRKYPERAEKVALQLWEEDRIFQPRVLHCEHPGLNEKWFEQGLYSQWWRRYDDV